MLPIAKISHVAVHEADWHKERLGKITASQIGRLMGEDSHKGKFTKGAITYLEELAHEAITGEQYKDEIFTKDIEYGNANEIEAIRYFSKLNGWSIVGHEERGGTHRFIVHDEVFGATPDALILVNPNKLFNDDETAINVRTLEVKCNRRKYIKYYKCKTPADLKKAEPIYYYQKMAQMEFCGAAVGYWGCFNDSFPIPGRLMEFKKAEMMDEFSKFNATCHYAKIELLKTIELFKN